MNDTSINSKDANTLWKIIVALNKSNCDQNNEITPGSKPTDMDAFFYIIVVLGFYASSIVLLLIKYSRKDDEEKFLNHQFSEFVKRDKFQSSTYQNRAALLRTQDILASLNGDKNMPTIKIQKCGDLEERRQTNESLTIDIPVAEGSTGQSIALNENMVTISENDVNLDWQGLETNQVYNVDSAINEGSEEVTVTQDEGEEFNEISGLPISKDSGESSDKLEDYLFESI